MTRPTPAPASAPASAPPSADVCLVLEGAYPHVAGGVSSWVHDLIQAQAPLRFHIVSMVADATPRPLRFELPDNVVGLQELPLQQPAGGVPFRPAPAFVRALVRDIEEPLARFLDGGHLADLEAMLRALRGAPPGEARRQLMNSQAALDMIVRGYRRSFSGSSFLDYFWSWRALVGGVLSVLVAPLPRARAYHAISTGFAGLLLARAVLETGRPGLLTEHGIYTNERRVEIAMAEWLAGQDRRSLDLEKPGRDLRDLWIGAFLGFSHACYEACDRITTLYAGNQILQMRDGAPPDRLAIIPNGIDYAALAAIPRDPAPRPPTVALIGRVVPIKDVKTFIRAVALLREMVPEVAALVMGPTEEDPGYFAECQAMVRHLELEGTVRFLGRVRLHDHLGKVDVVALTSISEAQPLVLLEAGAAGVPSVASDVGSCREIILGPAGENPPLGAGGAVTPLSDPLATARALAALLGDSAHWERCSQAIRRRVERYYNKTVVDRIYRDLYDAHLALPDRATPNR